MRRVVKVLQADCNAELLESIILVLISSTTNDQTDQIETQKGSKNISSNGSTEIIDSSETEILRMSRNEHYDEIDVYDWFEAFTTLKRFDLTIRFFSRDLITDILKTLDISQKEGYEELLIKYKSKA